MKKFEHERIGKPKRRGCNSICFVQILCSLFLVGCLALLGYAIYLIAVAHQNKSSPTINQLNLVIANWTDGLPQIKTWMVDLHLPTENNTTTIERMQPTQENFWPGPSANPNINDYEHYWFIKSDITPAIVKQKSDQVFDQDIVNLFNVTFDFQYYIEGGSSGDGGNNEIYDLTAFFGQVDRSSKEDCEKIRTGYYNDVNQYCYFYTQLTKICLVVIQEPSSPYTYDLAPNYQHFPCTDGDHYFLDFVPFQWKNAPQDPVLSDLQTEVRVELRSDMDPYVWAKMNHFGEGSDIPESLQIVMGFILLCVALLLFIIPIRLLCFRKYLKRYTEENELRPHRYSNIV